MDITNLTHSGQNIENRIFTLRGFPVMLDSDLAELYGVETKMINRAVKRNPDRFPEEFYFSLTAEESMAISKKKPSIRYPFLRYQNGTLKPNEQGRHRKYLPKAFTEHGVAMHASVLRNETAAKVSVLIIKTFVAMRNFIVQHESLFERMEKIDNKLMDADQKFHQIFKALETRSQIPRTGIFFEGQVFDAWVFVSNLIRSANHSILLIDNYLDDTVLQLFLKRKQGVAVTLYTRQVTPPLKLEVEKLTDNMAASPSNNSPTVTIGFWSLIIKSYTISELLSKMQEKNGSPFPKSTA